MRKTLMFVVITLALAGLSGRRAGAAAPAKVDCEVQENGKPALASLRVMAGETQIAKGSCGRPVEVPAGSYDLWVVLDGAVDSPVSKQHVELKEGGSTKAKASFETGEILVELTRDGRRTVGTIKLLRGAEVLATLTPGVANHVSAGTYSVEIESKGTRRTLDAVTVARGERRRLSADLSASGTASGGSSAP
jgi:hypothetical protein